MNIFIVTDACYLSRVFIRGRLPRTHKEFGSEGEGVRGAGEATERDWAKHLQSTQSLWFNSISIALLIFKTSLVFSVFVHFQIKLFCVHPVKMMMESKLEVHKDKTLREATEMAYKVCFFFFFFCPAIAPLSLESLFLNAPYSDLCNKMLKITVKLFCSFCLCTCGHLCHPCHSWWN